MRKLVFNRAAETQPVQVPPPGAGNRCLYLFHHCVAAEDEAGQFGGWTDSPLTTLGLTQRAEMIDYCEAQDITFEKLWSSDLLRATQTSEALVTRAIDKVVTQTKRARSWGIGTVISGQLKTDKQYKDLKKFYVEHPDEMPPGDDAETLNDSKSRWLAFMMSCFAMTGQGHANGIVAHGNNIKNTCQTFGFGKLKVGHGAICRLVLSDIGDLTFECLFQPKGSDIGAEDDDIRKTLKSGKVYRSERRYAE